MHLDWVKQDISLRGCALFLKDRHSICIIRALQRHTLSTVSGCMVRSFDGSVPLSTGARSGFLKTDGHARPAHSD